MDGLPQRLAQQIRFIIEIDKLKAVLRRSYVTCADRRENSAEHSWHVAMMAMTLAEYAEESVDLLRVLKMVLIHDIIEIDADDTFCYDEAGNRDKAEREQRAADRLFNLLPRDQADEFRVLWDEFEARQTPESRFAAALDRLMPLLHNVYTEGRTWQKHDIVREQVLAHNRPIEDGAPTLWTFARAIIQYAVDVGYLAAGGDELD